MTDLLTCPTPLFITTEFEAEHLKGRPFMPLKKVREIIPVTKKVPSDLGKTSWIVLSNLAPSKYQSTVAAGLLPAEVQVMVFVSPSLNRPVK